MSEFRKALVRANFEAYRDLTWAETLEPRFREAGVVDPALLNEYRAAWNAHAEREDWAWWQSASRRSSNQKLDDERMDCIERLDQLGCLQWQRDQAAKGQAGFQGILEAKPSVKQPTVGPDREQSKGRGD